MENASVPVDKRAACRRAGTFHRPVEKQAARRRLILLRKKAAEPEKTERRERKLYFSLIFLMISMTMPLKEGSLVIRFSTFWMA